MRYSVHLNLDRYGDLLLHFLCGAAWPLRNDLDVIISYVRVSLDRKVVKRYGSPDEQENRHHQNDEAVPQRIFDEAANHFLTPAPVIGFGFIVRRCSAAPTRCSPLAARASIPRQLPASCPAAFHPT